MFRSSLVARSESVKKKEISPVHRRWVGGAINTTIELTVCLVDDYAHPAGTTCGIKYLCERLFDGKRWTAMHLPK